VNRLTVDTGRLTIRWYNRPAKLTVSIEDIEEIRADESFVRIVLKTGRIIRLPTGMLDFDEKRAVRKFLKEATGI
jgi:polyisoprenoid-binding protein YceI